MTEDLVAALLSRETPGHEWAAMTDEDDAYGCQSWDDPEDGPTLVRAGVDGQNEWWATYESDGYIAEVEGHAGPRAALDALARQLRCDAAGLARAKRLGVKA